MEQIKSSQQKKMETWVKKAKTLMEALPYIQRFYGKRVVIKYGGSAMAGDSLKETFVRDIIMMQCIGIKPIIVHGGGPQIGEMLTQLGLPSRFHRGVRITDDQTMDVVEMVLVGRVNKAIVGLIEQFGGKAAGLSGKDGRLIIGNRLKPEPVSPGSSELVDFGCVGDVAEVNPDIIYTLEAGGFIPVIAPVGVDAAGQSLNINADLVAAALAVKLKAEKFVLLTDVEGVLDASKTLISSLTVAEISRLINDGVISGGMIPKLTCCAHAVSGGVSRAHIVDGRVEHAVLLEIFTDRGVGTLISG